VEAAADVAASVCDVIGKKKKKKKIDDEADYCVDVGLCALDGWVWITEAYLPP
jgi:hypothetical protein